MKGLRVLVLLILLALSVLSGFLFYTQYFQWRDCFNAMGRCIDAQSGVVYHEQSGLVWFLFIVLTSGLLIFRLWRYVRTKKPD